MATQPELPREAITLSMESFIFKKTIPPCNPSFDKFENQLCEEVSNENFHLQNGHVQTILVDSVINEKLACTIFQVISGTKPQYSPLLEELTLLVSGANYGTNINWIVNAFTSTWRVVRGLHFRTPEKLIAEELQPDEENTGGRYNHPPA